VDLDREFIEVLSRQRAQESRFPDAARLDRDVNRDEHGLRGGDTPAAGREGFRERSRTMVADPRPEAADVVPLLLQTQQLLAEQQLQLAEALRAVHEQSAEQREIAAEQSRISEQLTTLRRQLAKERKLQRAAADYIATHGRHRSE
jgi:small-conductance mechanosensitive channel